MTELVQKLVHNRGTGEERILNDLKINRLKRKRVSFWTEKRRKKQRVMTSTINDGFQYFMAEKIKTETTLMYELEYEDFKERCLTDFLSLSLEESQKYRLLGEWATESAGDAESQSTESVQQSSQTLSSQTSLTSLTNRSQSSIHTSVTSLGTIQSFEWIGTDATLICWCKKAIDNKFVIVCTCCHNLYHGMCVKVSREFIKTITAQNCSWLCVPCQCKLQPAQVQSEDVILGEHQHSDEERVKEEEENRSELKALLENQKFQEAAEFAANIPPLQTAHTMELFLDCGHGKLYNDLLLRKNYI